jgi:hypothetical protein
LKASGVKRGTTNIQHPTTNGGGGGKAAQSHTLAKAEMLKAETAEATLRPP